MRDPGRTCRGKVMACRYPLVITGLVPVIHVLLS
jgi:hypothetical protein